MHKKLLYWLLCLSTFSVGQTEQQTSTNTIRLATYRYASYSRLQSIRSLGNLLEERLGIKIEVSEFEDVHQLVQAIENEKVDIALISTKGYDLLKERKKNIDIMEVVAALEVPNSAKDQYSSTFIVQSQSPISSLKELINSADLTIALVNPGSTSGDQIPRLLLKKIGIDNLEQNFHSVKYAQTHQRTIELVATKQADVAAMGSAAYSDFIKKPINKSKIKAIYHSSPIPLGPVLFHKKLDTNIKKKLKTLFLSMHLSAKPVLEKIKAGWTEAKAAERYISVDSTYYNTLVPL